ncbi:hypothetical protein TNCV_944121 [Trichonephila clavipes]|nr:hypothetical protein TNCV_944121 [Trichonephila clavipes]
MTDVHLAPYHDVNFVGLDLTTSAVQELAQKTEPEKGLDYAVARVRGVEKASMTTTERTSPTLSNRSPRFQACHKEDIKPGWHVMRKTVDFKG